MPALADGSPRPGPGDWRAAGWLSDSTAFPTGPVGDLYVHRLFCERLAEACRSWVVDVKLGSHTCPLCPAGLSGNGEVHAIDRAGGRWAAPTLVHHYVTGHDYRPPDGFVDAVLAGTVHPPDRPSMGALRLGEAVGALDTLDPDLAAQARDELGDGVEITVREGERCEDRGVWRPVLALWITAGGATGGRVVAYDGTDSWRAAVRVAGGPNP
jgi:hypothetical protein